MYMYLIVSRNFRACYFIKELVSLFYRKEGEAVQKCTIVSIARGPKFWLAGPDFD